MLIPDLCPKCGHEPPSGASFCNQCGTAIVSGVKASHSDLSVEPTSRVTWYVAGALILGLILVITYTLYGPIRSAISEPSPPSPAGSPIGASSVDLSTMTPRQAADRLFNRVMAAAERGNNTEVVNFLPMAIRAHEMIEGLDADGKFHLVLLNLQASLNKNALISAREILAESPKHLLGLVGAADASLALGDTASARVFYQDWLDAYDSEIVKKLPEYIDHRVILETKEMTARALLGKD